MEFEVYEASMMWIYTNFLNNWSVHKNAAAKEFYIRSKIRYIEWPSYSPDLNPIENLWSLMKEKL